MAIHTGTKLNKSPALIGVLDTLTTKFSTDQLADNILNSKNYLTKSIRNKVVKKWSKDFYRSKKDILRSLNSYFSHSVLGKRNICLIEKPTNKQFWKIQKSQTFFLINC